jgi:ParB/RepB/Spo0J family partition protein
MATKSKGSKTLKETNVRYFKVDPRNIEVREGFNIRTDYGDLDELAASIKSEGVKVSLKGHRKTDEKGKVIPDKYVLTGGHRRLAACMLLLEQGNEPFRVPFSLEEKHYTDEQRLFDMFTENDGLPLSPVEKAEGVSRLLLLGYSPTEVANKLGKDLAFVSNMQALAQAPKKLKSMINQNHVSATVAMEIYREEKDYDKATQRIERALTEMKVSSPEKEKLTKKELLKAEKSTNSMGLLKKFIKSSDESKVVPERKELYRILKALVGGKLSYEQIEDMCYNYTLEMPEVAEEQTA